MVRIFEWVGEALLCFNNDMALHIIILNVLFVMIFFCKCHKDSERSEGFLKGSQFNSIRLIYDIFSMNEIKITSVAREFQLILKYSSLRSRYFLVKNTADQITKEAYYRTRHHNHNG